MSDFTFSKLLKDSYGDISKEILGTLYNDAPALADLPSGLTLGMSYLKPEVAKKELSEITILDTFKITWFKSIPLTWILRDDNNNYLVDVTREGVTVCAPIASDRELAKKDLYEMREYIKRQYNKEVKIEKFYNDIKGIADKACEILGVEYETIRLYDHDEYNIQWGFCNQESKTINFDYNVADMPYKALCELVVHECCHLKIEGHGEDFWELFHSTIDESKLPYVLEWDFRNGHKYYDCPFFSGYTGFTYSGSRNKKYELKFTEKYNYEYDKVNKS